MTSIAIVGAGFGGVGAAALLRRAGYADVVVFERAARVGGVWEQNTYPGAACDIPSHLYEFSFAPNLEWSRRYATQAEIQSYIERVARDHGILERTRFDCEVTHAEWNERCGIWRLETAAGPHEAQLLIAACGQLSTPAVPPIAGLQEFEGPAFHTARWRHDVDLRDRRVAVLGTGASAIQVVPALQPTAASFDVYQRSPPWVLPKLDVAYGDAVRRLFRRVPALSRLDRSATFAMQELGAMAMTNRPELRAPLRKVAERHIARSITDPDLRRLVTPSDEIGCKRVLLSDEWYPALTRDNVTLRGEAIDRITASGVRTADGADHPADVLVLATGFAAHGFVAPMTVEGRDGRTLADEWAEVPRAYLGLTVPGFPNLFLLYGPNTNGGTGSVVYTIEAGIRHVIAALDELRRTGSTTIAVRRSAADAFDRRLRAALDETVWHTGCRNWYVDEHGNDPNQWPWTWRTYRRRTARLDREAYELTRGG